MNDIDKLIRFIFNDESFIVTGNDNCDESAYDWMKNKLVRANNYEHELIRK